MTVLTVVGARPQFVKLAPVSKLLRSWSEEVLLHTGQHHDDKMSKSFFSELGLPEPDINLGVGGGTHAEQTAKMLVGVERAIERVKPEMVIVYGDTNSTLAGALAAAKAGAAVAHVEAGMRSGRRDMAEEINRILVDHVSALLLCPTKTAVDLLAAEGVVEGVHLVGDVMVDALESIAPMISRGRAAAAGAPSGDYYAATLHRAENVDDPDRLRAAMELLRLAEAPVVFPMHPRTRKRLRDFGVEPPANVKPIDPLGYVDMAAVAAHASCLLTDSGGLQKESVLLGTRCVTLRDETEWPETLAGGWNTLVGLDRERLSAALVNKPDGPPSGAFRPGAARRVDSALRALSDHVAETEPPAGRPGAAAQRR